MATAARIVANQANALLSTGPRTPEGKARSAQNSRTHGLFSAVDAFTPLDREAYQAFLQHFTHTWAPTTDASLYMVEQLALAHFRLERVRAIQASYLARQVRTLCETEGRPAPLDLVDQAALEARAHLADAQGPKLLPRFHRYEQSFLREIRRLEAGLAGLPHEPTGRCAPRTPAVQNEPIASAAIPRSAPCPCGSGRKFKRCCGQNAPALLHCPAGQPLSLAAPASGLVR